MWQARPRAAGDGERRADRDSSYPDLFWYCSSSREVIRPFVMTYVRFPLSLCNVEDLLFERRADICHKSVRMWRNRCCQSKYTARCQFGLLGKKSADCFLLWVKQLFVRPARVAMGSFLDKILTRRTSFRLV